ncbi:hypothetical protein SASPL_136184 [Salvia splendens]|uniref:Protease Do-like PDZ domain-containing protein n=1 Tax=Salvia splendens TaxID=180675 RepID=A0A8X8WXS1_SALSN|nr:hypothetical protein SASPL_136184 [Salvia splendens]
MEASRKETEFRLELLYSALVFMRNDDRKAARAVPAMDAVVKKRGSDTKYVATVLAIGEECDIAINSGGPVFNEKRGCVGIAYEDVENVDFGAEWQKPENPDLRLYVGMKPDEKGVLQMMEQVLAADINIGYENIFDTQILAFNGEPVKNLKSLASMVDSCNEECLKFDLVYEKLVVLRTKTAKAATLDILATHCIPSAMSDDLKA